jgi:hypothetical protein
MSDLGRIHSVKDRVQSYLLSIPGVHAVGVGTKQVGGKRTDEPAIRVFLVEKKPASEVFPTHLVPAEIEGIKTDVVQMAMPRLMLDFDTSRERPLLGGTTIQPKGIREIGTFGCFGVTQDAPPKVVALTCQHVVCPPVGSAKSALGVTLPPGSPNPYVMTFTGSNTPSTIVFVALGSPSLNRGFSAFWSTEPGDLKTVAKGVRAAVNSIADAHIFASIEPDEQSVTITTQAGFDTEVRQVTVFDPLALDTRPKLIATIAGNTITFRGKVDDDYGVYVMWNTDGSEPTNGCFAVLPKNSSLANVVAAVVKAVTDLNDAEFHASPTGDSVKIDGAQQLQCNIIADNRVGQPSDDFSSNCSLCCTDELGRVVASSPVTDMALIHVRRGLEYFNQVKGDDSVPVGDTFVTGVHTDDDLHYPVTKRGAVTRFSRGTLTDHNLSGIIRNASDTPPLWSVLYRVYGGAKIVQGETGKIFAKPGDSGSAVLDGAGKVVGILFGGDDTHGLVTPINQITTQFKLTILTATALNQKQTVSDAQGSIAFARLNPELLDPSVREAQAEIVGTSAGKELTEAVMRNVQEVQSLINENPRVATVWRRNGGPVFVEALLRYLKDRTTRLPEQIEGIAFNDRLSNLARILLRHGSPPLASDIRRYGPQVLALTNLTFAEALDRMRAPLTGAPT